MDQGMAQTSSASTAVLRIKIWNWNVRNTKY